MFSQQIARRIICGRVFPLVSRTVKTARVLNVQIQHAPLSHITSFTYAPNSVVPRQYSQDVNTQIPTADYDYVKKATTSNDVLIIDVREPDEIKEHGHIPNSINIPLGNVKSVLSSMAEKEFQETYKKPKPKENSEIIFYCMIGKRSGKAQQNAVNLGFKNVKNYLGSWTDWASKQ